MKLTFKPGFLVIVTMALAIMVISALLLRQASGADVNHTIRGIRYLADWAIVAGANELIILTNLREAAQFPIYLPMMSILAASVILIVVLYYAARPIITVTENQKLAQNQVINDVFYMDDPEPTCKPIPQTTVYGQGCLKAGMSKQSKEIREFVDKISVSMRGTLGEFGTFEPYANAGGAEGTIHEAPP